MANQEGSGTGRFGEAIGSAMSGYAGKLRGATEIAGGKLVGMPYICMHECRALCMPARSTRVHAPFLDLLPHAESVGHAVGSADIAQEGARQRQQGQSEWAGTARDRLPAPGPDTDTTVRGNRDLGPQGYAAQGASDRERDVRDMQGQDRDMGGQGRDMGGQVMQGQGQRGQQGWDAARNNEDDDVGVQSSMDAGDVQGSRDVGTRGGQGYPSTQNASRW